jgi:cell wall-associated NlpC family hydrolase
MTHAEQYSTSEPSASLPPRKKARRRVISMVALAATLGLTSTVISSSRPASADQISDARAQAAAITAKIQATEAQIQTLTGQVTAADYRLSQLNAQIAANQIQVAKDQVEVTKDTGQLRTEAISDYTSSGTTNQVTQMFSSNLNTSGIRSEYSSIATGNVTTTIDNLHTAQTRLQATQSALQQQQTQATATRDSLTTETNQATSLAEGDKATLSSVDANIQNLVAQQRAAQARAAKAAATAAFNAKLAAAQSAQAAAQAAAQVATQTVATHTTSVGGSSGGSSSSSGGSSNAIASVPAAPPPPLASGAAGAVQAAEREIGVPYVWGGESPAGFDCSGLVAWSYAQVGISLPHYSGAQYDDTTHIPLADIEPGDLLFYGPGGSEHVAMYVGGGSMIEAPYTGASVWITGVRTGSGFAGVGRVG